MFRVIRVQQEHTVCMEHADRVRPQSLRNAGQTSVVRPICKRGDAETYPCGGRYGVPLLEHGVIHCTASYFSTVALASCMLYD